MNVKTGKRVAPLDARLTLTYEAATELTGLSKSTLVDAVLSGGIKAFKPGREAVLLREDVERFALSRPLEAHHAHGQ
jgi:excisionase family DNA binding protein